VTDRRTWELAAPAALLAAAAWRRRWVTEDAFINFRVVAVTRRTRQPLVFNGGERVEAGTSPLWTAALLGMDVVAGRRVALEKLAVGAGLGLSVLGLSAATAACARLTRARGSARPRPAGALVLAVLPPVWDFATSGMETGLTFGWLGGCQWLLARRFACALDRGPQPPLTASPWLPVALGLGPLVRPDLTLFSAAFLAVELALRRPGIRDAARTVGTALALPAAYQVFRMAYFASTVPNTALAKEANRSNWRRGLAYLDNHLSPYRLTTPATLVAVWAAKWLIEARPCGRLVALIGAPAAAALAHGAFIVRVGGDFMHARLLLPATFGLFMVVAALPVEPVGVLLPVALAVWAVTCGLRRRLPRHPPVRWRGIVDERAWWQRETGRRHPVTLADYGRVRSTRSGGRARRLAARGADVLVRIDGAEIPLAPGSGVVLESITIGMGATAAGPDVHVIDVLGLADAVGSRIAADPHARTGHQKRLPPAWVLARVRLADAALPDDVTAADLQAARRVLADPAVARLLSATRAPLTPRRALRNLVQSFGLTRLRITA
jgi:arabinofuranosyltransferase